MFDRFKLVYLVLILLGNDSKKSIRCLILTDAVDQSAAVLILWVTYHTRAKARKFLCLDFGLP